MERKRLIKLFGAIFLAVMIAIPFAAGCAAPAPAPAPAPSPAPAPAPSPSPAPAPTPVPTEEMVKWRFQSTMVGASPEWPFAEEFVAHIAEATDGQFIIEMYESGALVTTGELFDAVGDGTIEMTWIWCNQFAGINSAFSLFTFWPFGPTMHELQQWYFHDSGLELADELYAKYNQKFFPAYFMGAEAGPYSKVPYPTLESMQGKTYRMGAGPGGDILRRLGVDVVVISKYEIYSSLDRGVVDLAEWGRTASDWALALHEVGPYNQMPAWFQPSGVNGFQINLDAWNALPPKFKMVFEMATWEMALKLSAWTEADNADYMKKMLDYGVEFIRLPDEDLAKIQKVALEVTAEYADENPDFKKIWESQQVAMKKYKEYADFLYLPK